MSELWKRNTSVPCFSRRKIKSFVFIVIFTISVLGLYAEAPELRNVMPNSWRKVTKLTAAEERAFVREHSAVLSEFKKIMDYGGLGWQDGSTFEHYSIYKQQVGTDTFHRVLYTENNSPNFLSPSIRFCQFLIYQKHYVTGISYNAITVTQWGYLGYYGSIDIIEGKEKAKGILLTELKVEKKEKDKFNKYIKGQLCGNTDSNYYLMEDIIKNIGSDKEYLTRDCPDMRISASSCLVDPNIPLRYSLQNAFDGDPSTSYVENTENDLIEISLTYFNYEKIIKIAVINGYAQNLSIYKRNNRIKTIGIASPEWNKEHGSLFSVLKKELLLKDNYLSYQFYNVSLPDEIRILNIYKGEAYNDTCLAELNLYFDGFGWLFGGIDE